ncbi:MAG: NAD(P)-dependent alcohol dehydrogenase [Ilumatobacteraceae bacterium]
MNIGTDPIATTDDASIATTTAPTTTTTTSSTGVTEPLRAPAVDGSARSVPDLPATMTAVTQRDYGSTEVLAVEQVALPGVGDQEVLIEVVAAGLDRGVWHLMTGLPYLVRLAGYGLRRPKQPIPGMDVAGRVVAVGAGVKRFAVGDAVMGLASGSFAEYAVADEDTLAFKPSNIGFEEAAVSTTSGITALQALTTVGRVEAGQRVLVIGASGGVGSFAVQIAKSLGAVVTGVASGSKLDFVTSLGADDVIDYQTTPVQAISDRFDLIVDIGGRTAVRTLRRLLVDRGTLVIVGGEDGGKLTGGIGRNLRAVMMSPVVEQRLTFFISSATREYIDPLVEMLAAGDVVAAIGQRSPLVDTAAAIRAIEAGTAQGKTVISVRNDG